MNLNQQNFDIQLCNKSCHTIYDGVQTDEHMFYAWYRVEDSQCCVYLQSYAVMQQCRNPTLFCRIPFKDKLVIYSAEMSLLSCHPSLLQWQKRHWMYFPCMAQMRINDEQQSMPFFFRLSCSFCNRGLLLVRFPQRNHSV